ncbi:MAG: type II CAAX endopeptidase family protein [Candidatus Sulfobium sp.]|jgi:membrane protease YdiL (CAAX protease family)
MTKLAEEGLNNRNPDGSAPPAGRREQALELAVFLFLIIPAMVLSFFVVRGASLSFVILAVDTVMRDLGLLSLVLFFVWRNGEPFAAVGCRRKNLLKEIGLGIALFIPLIYILPALESTLHKIGLTSPSNPLSALTSEKGIPEVLLASLMVMVVAVAEETIFRGYLILRLETATRSRAWAIGLSAVIFSLGHGYEGSAGMATVAFLGVVLAWVYLWRQNLVAAVVIHFLQDFSGIVLLPLLKQLNLLQ